MMRKVAGLACVLSLLGAPTAVIAQKASAGSSANTVAVSGSLQDQLHRPVVMRGTLGGDNIQLTLKPKEDEDGVSGDYFVFGQSTRILLAGEVDQNDLAMEESRNGKDVSGQWEGSFSNGIFSGVWSDFDGTVTKPFSLKITLP